MLFSLILLIEIGCAVFFLCRYLNALTKKANGNNAIVKTHKIKRKSQQIVYTDDEIVQYLENIDNFYTNTPQKEFE